MFDTHVSQDKLTTNVAISDGKPVILELETQLVNTVLSSPVKHGPRVWIPSTHVNLVPPVYNPSAGKVGIADPGAHYVAKVQRSRFSEKLSLETR